ncbi:NAD(P)-dependent oxidoreductase, partial [Arthrobacter sp. R4]
ADALATAPLAELMPRFLPGSEALAAGLTGTSPAFSIAKARDLLGWEPQRSWRTELKTTTNLNDETAASLVTAGAGSKETP